MKDEERLTKELFIGFHSPSKKVKYLVPCNVGNGETNKQQKNFDLLAYSISGFLTYLDSKLRREYLNSNFSINY